MNTVTDGDRRAAQMILILAAIGAVSVVRIVALTAKADMEEI